MAGSGIYDDEKTRKIATPSVGSHIDVRPHVDTPRSATSLQGQITLVPISNVHWFQACLTRGDKQQCNGRIRASFCAMARNNIVMWRESTEDAAQTHRAGHCCCVCRGAQGIGDQD